MRILIAGDRREWCEAVAVDLTRASRAPHTIALAWPGNWPSGRHDLVLVRYGTTDALATAAHARMDEAGAILQID